MNFEADFGPPLNSLGAEFAPMFYPAGRGIEAARSAARGRAFCIERYNKLAVVCLSFFIACLTEALNVFMLSGPHAIQVYRRPGVPNTMGNQLKIDL